MTVRIGTSGWSYDHWTSVLYPPGIAPAKRLARYVQEFDTVELNASFYRWPRDTTFEGWRQRLPEGFTMTVKAHRGLTHYRRLKSPEPWVERFERCWRALGDRREALLVQLHPGLQRDDDLLHRHDAAYVVMSGAGLPCVLRATSRLVYVRMHGPDQHTMYGGSYSDGDLSWWCDRIVEWQDQGRDVLVYFNNDGAGHAVRNAWTLKGLLTGVART